MPDRTTPRRWTLALKLALAVLVLALVPQIVVAVINVGQVRSALEEHARDALARRAVEASRRLEERVGRLSAYSELLATNPQLVEAVAEQPVRPGRGSASARRQLWIERAQAWDAAHEDIYELLVSVRRANPWFQHAYLLDANGLCIASSERETKPDMVGRVYDYRPYYRAPMADQEPYVTDVLKNANSPGTAIFVSAPVIQDDRVAAVVVIKIDTAALHDVVADLSRRGGRTLLVDRFGVVVSHASDGETVDMTEEGSLQFHALASVDRYRTLFEDTKRYGDPGEENYLDRVADPLGLDGLWQRLRSGGSGADLYDAFPVEPSGPTEPTMVGYAVVLAAPTEPYGYVVVAEPASEFREPLERLAGASILRSILVVGGVVLVLTVLIGRLSRRLGRLVDGARRVTDGDLGLRLDDERRDELAELAGQFDRMTHNLSTTIDALERERDETKNARHEAERARATKEAFLTDIARRLAGPLDSVSEASRSLRGVVSGDDAAAALSSIEEATSTMQGVVEQMRTLTGTTSLSPERVDIDALLRRIVESARPTAAASSTKLELRIDAPLGEAIVDRIKLRQILVNLVDNASRYTRDGQVVVTAIRHPDGLEVRVVDTGIGMTRGQIERFERAVPSDADPENNGVGLVVSRLAAIAMHGALSVRSAAGEGSEFTLRVPVEWTTPS